MAPYGILDTICDSVGMANTVVVLVWLVTGLQPAFKRVRDSWREGKVPEERARLRWSLLLVVVVWYAAAVLYVRNVFSLWDVMGDWLESEPVNRPVYALLHLYLYLLILCGIYACTITVVALVRNNQALADVMFRTKAYRMVDDIEAQHGSSAIGLESQTAGDVDVRHTTSPPHDEGLPSNGHGLSENLAPTTARTMETEHPAQEPTRLASDHPVGQFVTWAVESRLRLVDADTLSGCIANRC